MPTSSQPEGLGRRAIATDIAYKTGVDASLLYRWRLPLPVSLESPTYATKWDTTRGRRAQPDGAHVRPAPAGGRGLRCG
jgi:hypothetical protein